MTTTPLPPLPEPEGTWWEYKIPGQGGLQYTGDFTADQMQAYATAARADLEAEVKRLKQAAEELSFLYGDLLLWTERAVDKGNANSDIEEAWARYEEWLKARAALENRA